MVPPRGRDSCAPEPPIGDRSSIAQDVAVHGQNRQLLAPPRRGLGRRVARSAGKIGDRVRSRRLQGRRQDDHVEPDRAPVRLRAVLRDDEAAAAGVDPLHQARFRRPRIPRLARKERSVGSWCTPTGRRSGCVAESTYGGSGQAARRCNAHATLIASAAPVRRGSGLVARQPCSHTQRSPCCSRPVVARRARLADQGEEPHVPLRRPEEW